MKNKAGYTATPVARGWAGAVIGKVKWAYGQEQRRRRSDFRDFHGRVNVGTLKLSGH